ncbi:hypothetical protein PHYSODRAFT_497418, partial [Phytophthora sojae]
MQRPNNCTALYIACEHGHAEVAELLVTHGADIELPDERGWTPLMAAAWKDHVDVVQLLLQHGA